jgi:hypothetical protein
MADIYYCDSAGSNTAPYDTWAKAATSLAVLSGIPWTFDDTVYVAPSHNHTATAAITLTCPTTPGLKIICTADNTTTPPTTLTTTQGDAVENVGAANAAYEIRGHAYFYGISFVGGTNANAACDIILGSGAVSTGLVFEKCRFVLSAASGGAIFQVGNTASATSDDSLIRLIDCAVKFAAANTNGINNAWGRCIIENLNIEAGVDVTNLFGPVANTAGTVLVENSDLTGDTYTNLVNVAIGSTHHYTFRDCKIPNISGSTVANGTNPGPGGPTVKMHNCDHTDSHFRVSDHCYEGKVEYNLQNYRTAGAVHQDGTPFSLQMTQTTTNPKLWSPLETPEIWIYNSQTGSSLTVDIQFMRDSATDFNNDELFMRLKYLTGTSVPLGSVASDRVADVLTTPAAQSSAGDSGWTETVANQNFNKLTKAITPTEPGWIIATVCLNSGTSGDSAYIDPYITVSGDTNTYKVSLIPGMGLVMVPQGGGGLMRNNPLTGGMVVV